MQKLTPFLWFDDQAEEAVKFYTSIFKNSKMKGFARYGEEGAVRVAKRQIWRVMADCPCCFRRDAAR